MYDASFTALTLVLDVRRRNFWNSWLRYRYRKQQQQGTFTGHVGSEWSDLLAAVRPLLEIRLTIAHGKSTNRNYGGGC